ncbi:energy transducer TonB [Pontibacter ramchanderi]|uniref:Antitoxin component YwqK of YwqJK toxin-antitoxin module n=1 Tax=Pontibacter ramchanderi TaxID=1179743 RepID=A0A2N3UBS8_9BACT|nr:energy transducer TonB [Pontibacter ramchanderi]PKV66828.1 antitoxin component YwqK of YwqJK toxin-antitoxin module [Pontibacter ramchanderi]
MKHFLLFIIACSFVQASFAQNTDPATYQPIVIPYNAKWEVTKSEAAVYRRLAYFPDSLRNLRDLKYPPFNYTVTDYYADGTVKAKGHYQDGKMWATWTFYYPNGQLDCKGKYDGFKLTGTWEFWWPDGKPLMVAEYDGYSKRVLSFWNHEGEQTVRDGNGIYIAITLDESGARMVKTGTYKDGYQAGEWTYGPEGGDPVVRQFFGEEGLPRGGVVYDNGKVKSKYTFGNKLPVEPEPEKEHAQNPTWWRPDPAYYEKNYPVVADVFNCQVEKVELDKKVKATAKHYYKIMQPFATGGIDTLEFGIPLVLPVFKKGLQSHLNTYLKLPNHLANLNLQGVVVAIYTVDAQGKVKNPSIIKSLDPALDEAVIKMLNKMPDWQPGTRNGKPVDIVMTLPIRMKGRAFMAEREENLPGGGNWQFGGGRF